MRLDEIARAVRPGALFRVTHTHFRPDDFTLLNKGATALIVACAEDSLVAEAVVTCPRSGGSRNLQLSALQIAEGEFWERCDAEVR
jgi:hypothetical protein